MPQSIARVGGWSRADGLVLEGLLGVMFIVQAIIGLFVPILGMVGVLDVAVSRDVPLAGSGAADIAAEQGIRLSGSGEALLTAAHPDAGQRALFELPVMAGAAMVLLGIYWLFLITRTLRKRDPFAPGNSRRLYGIAVLILLGSAFGDLLTAVTTNVLVAGTTLQDRVPFSFDIPLWAVAAAVLVAALAEAFRIGGRLRHATEGLV